MKKLLIILFAFAFTAGKAFAAEPATADSIRSYVTPSVTVTAARALEQYSPVPFSEMHFEEIQAKYALEDIPMILADEPSIISYSISGNGIGYSTLTMRGFDQRRISVLINGIPQNDPEEHNVYWVDVPDLAESVESIQIQRGAGLVNYGSSTIGGSINISTSNFASRKGVKVLAGNGWQEYASDNGISSNVSKFAFEASSGLIDEKYALYGRLSRTNSWGYRDHSWAFLNSYFLGAAVFGDIVTTQINVFGGPFTDGLAYVGLPKEWVKDKALRRKNLDAWEYDTTGAIEYTAPQIARGVEEFSQPHYEILNEVKISENVKLKSSLFYYTGEGYFDFNGSWANKDILRLTPQYGFDSAMADPEGTIIRASVNKRQWGWLPTLQWTHKGGQFTIGGEARIHRSDHQGGIAYANNLPAGFNPDFRIYENKVEREIFSVFAREQYYLAEKLLLSGEVQGAMSNYRINEEKAGGIYTSYPTIDGGAAGNGDDIFDISYYFFNPRIGATYTPIDDVSIYASAAFTSSEPTMLNLYAADYEYYSFAGPLFHNEIRNGVKHYDFTKPLVKPEKLLDFEAGSNYQAENLKVGLNLYWMEYFDELVKSGQLDIFGNPIDGNAPRTRHYGIELQAEAEAFNNKAGTLKIYANTTLSQNKIVDYTYGLYGGDSISLEGNDIGGFPSFMINAGASYKLGGFRTMISARYIGPYRTDNLGDLKAALNDPATGEKLKNSMKYAYNYYEDNQFDGYVLVNADFSYELGNIFGAKSIMARLRINNLLNNFYAAGAEGKNFFPGAERNYYFSIDYGL